METFSTRKAIYNISSGIVEVNLDGINKVNEYATLNFKLGESPDDEMYTKLVQRKNTMMTSFLKKWMYIGVMTIIVVLFIISVGIITLLLISKSDVNECDSNPCLNGATCVDGESMYTCSCKIEGGFTMWTSWGECTMTCGNGSQSKYRTCTNPVPQFDGADCVGEHDQTRTCHSGNCPVKGGFMMWTSWGECTMSCGDGSMSRSRTCTNPVPQFGGAECVGERDQTRTCHSGNCQDCPSGWQWFGSYCYLFEQGDRSWEDSKTFCESQNASLVTVECSDEDDYLRGIMSAQTLKNYYWIGARWNAEHNDYRWIDLSTFDFKGWGPGRPRNNKGCLDYLYNKKVVWQWNDHGDCVTTTGSCICETDCSH